MPQYDLAISFAGEQRALAEGLAVRLDASGYSIFYDNFEKANLWGEDLSVELGSVYEHDARFCLIIVSKEYIEKAWTNFERQHAISRFMKEKSNYILCLVTDESILAGFPATIGYIDLRNSCEDEVYRLLLKKLGTPYHDNAISNLSENDKVIAKRILGACYRRAIFTRMESEINLDAMNRSLAEALRGVQSLAPKIADQSMQYAALEIISCLDEIERCLKDYIGQYCVSKNHAQFLNQKKMKIVRHLLEIRRAGHIAMQLPYALRVDHFFNQDDADAPPLKN